MSDWWTAALVAIGLASPAPEHKWPWADCTESRGVAMSTGWSQYKIIELSPGHCGWVEDREAERQIAEGEAHREALWRALRTRVLTDSEMREALGYGDGLNIRPNVSYSEADKIRELGDGFVTQAKLRAAAGMKP